ncbi:MAG: glycosyltransferase family 39 protein [Bacteroidales bacterium]|nr:glycosyltransferase family 39 protein [Bacteroidales bacterium]
MKNYIINKIRYYKQNYPLRLLILTGLILRLIAAVFSKGFAMHDDHFLVIEAAQSWVDGSDYNRWLPVNNNTQPSGHSFLYPGLHFLFFSFLNFINITDPLIKMFFVRLIHCFYSLLCIYFTYKITEKLSNRVNAFLSGLLIATLWFFPFISVRNLVEVVSMPLLLASVWFIIKNNPLHILGEGKGEVKNNFKNILIAGFFAGLAFSVRFQTIVFSGAIILVLVIDRKWSKAFFYGLTMLITICLTQLPTDLVLWNKAFAELTEYIRYNLANAGNYISHPWYHYLIVIIGFLIPPLSIFLFYGFFRLKKQNLILFLPAFAFLLFHSVFPNKQERFIITIIPFIIIAGIIGWNDFKEKSAFWNRNQKLYNYCLIFFWVLNLLTLPFITTMYSKKARVESMVYLSQFDNIKSVMIEGDTKLPPRFYLKQWIQVYDVSVKHNYDGFYKAFSSLPIKDNPRFILFFNNDNLPERVNKIKTVFPDIKYETSIEPGFIDKILYWLNPKNANQQIIIYRN